MHEASQRALNRRLSFVYRADKSLMGHFLIQKEIKNVLQIKKVWPEINCTYQIRNLYNRKLIKIYINFASFLKSGVLIPLKYGYGANME
jgi:hypothetical protein